MLHVRWVALGLALILLAARDQDSSEPSDTEGTWEILSVYRDGEADPSQEGGHLTFANGRVTFTHSITQFNRNDGQLFAAGFADDSQVVKEVSLRQDDLAAAAFG